MQTENMKAVEDINFDSILYWFGKKVNTVQEVRD